MSESFDSEQIRIECAAVEGENAELRAECKRLRTENATYRFGEQLEFEACPYCEEREEECERLREGLQRIIAAGPPEVWSPYDTGVEEWFESGVHKHGVWCGWRAAGQMARLALGEGEDADST